MSSPKIIFAADLHYKPNDSFRKRELKHFFSLLERNHDIPDTYICLLGDVFDSTTGIDWDFFIDLYTFLSKFKGVQIIIGNHDCLARSPHPRGPMKMLLTLPNLITIFDSWDYYNTTKPKQTTKILLAHKDVLELNPYPDKEYAVSLKDLSSWDLVINGHLHVTERHKNVILPGPPYPTSFGDTCKGIYLYFDGKTLTSIETSITKCITVTICNTDAVTKRNTLQNVIQVTNCNITECNLEELLAPYKGYQFYRIKIPQSKTFPVAEDDLAIYLDVSPENIKLCYVTNPKEESPSLSLESQSNIPSFEDVLSASTLPERAKRVLRSLYAKEAEKIRSSY